MEKIEKFVSLALQRSNWLEEKGFYRDRMQETLNALSATIVYKGKNLAFRISFDYRDQCVDLEVVKVFGGLLKGNIEGGYSTSLFDYLVNFEGYRGNPCEPSSETLDDSVLGRQLDGCMSLLRTIGDRLLTDPASFPD